MCLLLHNSDAGIACADLVRDTNLYASSSSMRAVEVHSLVFSPIGRSGRSQSPVWLLAHCILGKFLAVVCHCFPPPLDVPTFAATCLCVLSDARYP